MLVGSVVDPISEHSVGLGAAGGTAVGAAVGSLLGSVVVGLRVAEKVVGRRRSAPPRLSLPVGPAVDFEGLCASRLDRCVGGSTIVGAAIGSLVCFVVFVVIIRNDTLTASDCFNLCKRCYSHIKSI